MLLQYNILAQSACPLFLLPTSPGQQSLQRYSKLTNTVASLPGLTATPWCCYACSCLPGVLSSPSANCLSLKLTMVTEGNLKAKGAWAHLEDVTLLCILEGQSMSQELKNKTLCTCYILRKSGISIRINSLHLQPKPQRKWEHYQIYSEIPKILYSCHTGLGSPLLLFIVY